MRIGCRLNKADPYRGVWSKSRIYSTMMTQSPLGMLEFSNYPMPLLPKSETFYDLFRGSHVGDYLEAFASHKTFGGKTVRDRIVFNAPVEKISKDRHVWEIQTPGESYSCQKLIVATGLTSTPTPIGISTQDFKPPVIHSLHLAAKTSLLASPEIKNVVVLGGAKSSFDAIQLLQSLGKSVTWIIRTNGQGPALLATPDAPWPLSNSHEIISTRLIAKMSPCIFEPLDAWTRFFHSNRLGIKLVDMMYAGINWMWRTAAGYNRSENMKMLIPDRPVYWSSDGIAVWNSPGMWDTVSKATILRDVVESFEGTDVLLKSGKRITCDAVVSATGWSNRYSFFEDQLAEELGLPMLPAEANGTTVSEWERRIKIADKMVVNTFPRLGNVPSYPDHVPKSTPSRLYRAIVPIEGDPDHSIAFLGGVGTTQSFSVAEVQALFAAAYLSNKLPLPSAEEMKSEVALATAWRRRRYLGDGYTFIFEQLQVCYYFLEMYAKVLILRAVYKHAVTGFGNQ